MNGFIHLSMTCTFNWLCPPAVIIREQIMFALKIYILFINVATDLSILSFTKPNNADSKPVTA